MARVNLTNRGILPALVLLAASITLAAIYRPSQVGCQTYRATAGPLIAHAGGGLPDRFYANNLDALNLAVKHGHKLIELDFIEKDGRLLVGHDEDNMSEMTLPQLMAWLDENPSISIVTDIKTDNLSGLAKLSKRQRFIPQIYSPAEFEPVSRMGFQKPILTVYRIGDDGWQDEANSIDLLAVAMPVERGYLARGIRHPVFLHTVNKPIKGYGLYTDCLIPISRSDRLSHNATINFMYQDNYFAMV